MPQVRQVFVRDQSGDRLTIKLESPEAKLAEKAAVPGEWKGLKESAACSSLEWTQPRYDSSRKSKMVSTDQSLKNRQWSLLLPTVLASTKDELHGAACGAGRRDGGFAIADQRSLKAPWRLRCRSLSAISMRSKVFSFPCSGILLCSNQRRFRFQPLGLAD